MTDHQNLASPASISHRIGEGGTFSLNNVSGAIRVTGGAGDTVELRARWERPSDEPMPLNVRRTDGGLHVELDDKSFPFRGGWLLRGPRGIEFDVAVPHGAQLRVNAVSSDIDVRATDGDQQYKTVSGDVHLDGVGGRVSLTTVSGDAHLTADHSVAADMNTTSGDLSVAAQSIDQFQFRTVSGDARVSGAFATGPLHTMESVSGDLRLEPSNGMTIDIKRGLDIAGSGGRRQVVGDGAAQFRFRTLSGDVSVAGVRWSTEPASGSAPPAASVPGDESVPTEASVAARTAPPAAESAAQQSDSIEILRALERGEIDVEEASRRLELVGNRG
jgi:hypothetical protein